MKKYNIIVPLLVIALLAILPGCNSGNSDADVGGPSHVELKKGAAGYQLYVNGEPFYIRGAGLEGGSIKELAAHGGNAMRTWRTDNRFRTGQQVLDEAQANGIMVCMGIEIGRERHGFDYHDSVAVRKQFEYAPDEVMK